MEEAPFMLAQRLEYCHDCSKPMLDLGDELVCPRCGLVQEKSIMEAAHSSAGKLPLFGRQPLGSYMGTKEMTAEERRSRISGDNTRYERMKAMSDFARKEGSAADCGRLVERVAEKLFLPRMVMLQAATVSKKMMETPHPNRRLTVAEVSAYSLVMACKIEGVTSVSIREILAAFAPLGRRVSSSSIFKLMLESPVGAMARRPEDYVPRVTARLSTNARLAARLARDGFRVPAYLESLRTLTMEILSCCSATDLDGKRPCSLAASAVYSAEVLLASTEGRAPRVTQRECAACGDAAEYTVREQFSSVFKPVIEKMSREPRLQLLQRAR